MFSKLKSALGLGASAQAPAIPPVEYNGYRILPAPYRNSTGSFQTAGVIEKDTPEGVKRHDFVRADTYESQEDAISFT
mgnify:CR=1 FL=1